MKTKSILKIAVVAMAALGAYAFSGNNANELKPFKIKEGGVCTNILAGCSNTQDGPICKIVSNNDMLTVYQTDCMIEARHYSETPVQWSPIN